MTFWSLMVQIKAEPGDLKVKPSIYQLLSSDPSKCAPCSPDLWHLSRNKALRPKALLSLSPGKTAAFSESAATEPFSFNKTLLQSSHITSRIFYLRLQSCVLQMIHKEKKPCIFIQPARGWRAGVLGKQGILCGNQFFVEVSILRMSVQPKFQREITSLSMPNTWRYALQSQ